MLTFQGKNGKDNDEGPCEGPVVIFLCVGRSELVPGVLRFFNRIKQFRCHFFN